MKNEYHNESIRCEQLSTRVPTYFVGPLKIHGDYAHGDFMIPLATYESPIAVTVQRGAKATYSHGINTVLTDHGWSRAPVFEAPNARRSRDLEYFIKNNYPLLKKVAESTTHHGTLDKIEPITVGKNIYVRINFLNGDAGGHNMTTKAAQAIVNLLRENFPDINLVSLSGNYCTDKKVSAVNSILGRGKKVIAETIISRDTCNELLKTSPEAIQKINTDKNYLGSILAGSICSANAHYSNMLAALYLATGQDIANLVEGSQGITIATVENDSLYFAVTLPNIVCGSIGPGTCLPDQARNLKQLGCKGQGENVSDNAYKLAEIIAATVLAGELNLLAVLTKNGELVSAHERLERKKETLERVTQKITEP